MSEKYIHIHKKKYQKKTKKMLTKLNSGVIYIYSDIRICRRQNIYYRKLIMEIVEISRTEFFSLFEKHSSYYCNGVLFYASDGNILAFEKYNANDNTISYWKLLEEA